MMFIVKAALLEAFRIAQVNLVVGRGQIELTPVQVPVRLANEILAKGDFFRKTTRAIWVILLMVPHLQTASVALFSLFEHLVPKVVGKLGGLNRFLETLAGARIVPANATIWRMKSTCRLHFRTVPSAERGKRDKKLAMEEMKQ